jgi:Protein of unknown function (DUF4054)
MATTVEWFLQQYPRFESVSPGAIQSYLDLAATAYCPVSVWGDRALSGIALLTAHFLEMEWIQTAQTSGMATQIAAGKGVSAPASSDDDFSLTTYGRQYKLLKATVPASGFVF